MKKLGYVLLLLVVFPVVVYAASGSTTLVFQQTSSALTAKPNVKVCVMSKGMVRDLSTSGTAMQTVICDSITGYFLGKKLTVSIAGSNYFYAQVDQDTLFNHDGHATNGLTIYGGTGWGESVR